MTYIVKTEYWLSQASDKVRSFLLLDQNVTRTWEVESLQQALADIGLQYTVDQLNLIGADLIDKGVIESVP